MTASSGRALPLQPPPTKTVIIYRNGDGFYAGRKFVINQRQISTFDSFLNSVTRGVEAPFGAVRNIYTPTGGHKILELEHLEHGERYVAAGAEKFKKLDYYQITTKKPQKKKNEQIRPVVHSRIIVSARWRKIINESCTINVFTNGDILVPPARILIPKYTLTNWDSVLAMVTERVHLRTGAVYRLCMLDGTAICDASELETNQYYVAVGVEKFRHLPYIQSLSHKDAILAFTHGDHTDTLPPVKRGKQAKDALCNRGGLPSGEDQVLTVRGLPRKKADSLFYARPEKAKQQRQDSKIPHPLSTRDGSVFTAKDKRKETIGATEVQEEGGMKVDLPIDQTEAKVIDEEQLDNAYPRPESGGQSPDGALRRGPNASATPRPCSPESIKASAKASSFGESGRGSQLNSSGGERSQSPQGPQLKDLQGVEPSSKLCEIRSRMSKIFKGNSVRA